MACSNDPGQDDGIPVDIGGTVQLDQSSQVQSLFAGMTITPNQDFTFAWNGVIAQFYAGRTTVVTPDLLVALATQSAPFSQP